jgi:polar amino acid transport system substrate-binding protein
MRILAFTLVVATSAAGAADLPEIKAKGTLRVIAASDEQPETFSFKAGTEPGFDKELLEGFARLQGLKVEAVGAKTYASRIPMLVAGEGDVIAAIFDTEERRKQVDFTAEVMPTHNVVVTLASAPPVTSLDQLRTQRVGVVKGTASVDETLAAGVPAANLVRFDDGEAALAALRGGSIGSTVRPASEFALSARRTKGLRADIMVGAAGKSAWAVRKDSVQLRLALDAYIANTRRATTWSRLVVKYFGDQALDVLGRKP